MRKVFLALLAAALPAISAFADLPAEEQMAHRIGSQLKQSGQLHNYEIGVKYHDGVASLLQPAEGGPGVDGPSD